MIQFWAPFTILILTAAGLLIFHWLKPEDKRQWMLALAGGLGAWVSVFLWRPQLPIPVTLGADNAFYPPLALAADRVSWPLGMALLTLLLAALLTAVARTPFPAPRRWAGMFTLTAAGLLTLLAADPITLGMLWVAIDFSELLIVLPGVHKAAYNERLVVMLTSRLAGVGILLWADILASASGQVLNFQAPSTRLAAYILLAAVLRLGILPIHLPLESGSAQQQELGVTLRVVASLGSLILLVRTVFSGLPPIWHTVLLLALIGSALHNSWRWLQAENGLAGRPYWLLGLSSLAGILVLQNNPDGVIALAVVMALGGGLISLYSTRKLRYSRILAGGSLLAMSALPFTLTADIWHFPRSLAALYWPFILTAYALLLAGYLHHLMRPSVLSLEHQTRAIRVLYLSGQFLLVAGLLAAGLFGWTGARQIGTPLAALLTLMFTGGIALSYRRWGKLLASQKRILPINRIGSALFSLLWFIYQTSGRGLKKIAAQVFENEGGLIWVLVIFLLALTYWIR